MICLAEGGKKKIQCDGDTFGHCVQKRRVGIPLDTVSKGEKLNFLQIKYAYIEKRD